jgi:hypothetical protein
VAPLKLLLCRNIFKQLLKKGKMNKSISSVLKNWIPFRLFEEGVAIAAGGCTWVRKKYQNLFLRKQLSNAGSCPITPG